MKQIAMHEFPAWERMKANRRPLSVEFELTARCNNNCRHCYINLPAGDQQAKDRELTPKEIFRIADEAASMGAMWCLLTGGEPLLRPDFNDIYMGLKQRGFLMSVFTNAAALTPAHAALFKRYPPRHLEVSVYGVTRETYERVSRIKGSFAAFERGVTLLRDAGIRIRFKAMAIRSTLHEMDQIADWCRERTKDYYRFDYQLHYRFDADEMRNREIEGERLTPSEIVALEHSDPERSQAMEVSCNKLVIPQKINWSTCSKCNMKTNCKQFNMFSRILRCGAGNGSFTVSYDGLFRLCSSLWHPDMVYDLRNGFLKDAWEILVPHVRTMQSSRREYLETCGSCPITNLCMSCAAHAFLETGRADERISYFCDVARARAAALTGDPQWLNRNPWEIDGIAGL